MVDKERVTCDVCGKSFYSRKQLEQHAQDAHNTINKNEMMKTVKPFKIRNKLIAVIAACVLIAIIGGIAIHYARAPAAALTIDGVQCNVVEQLLFHIHAHLDIIINGVYFLVPSQIGIPSSCFFWLHTHDESGIIHIESPVNRDYTLGQFFDIWNKKLNNDQIFNYVTNANTHLTVYVNGTKVPNGTNYRDIKLHAHDEIAIVYGTPPSTIPSSYKFPQGI
ncbi:MAG: hypothetical protein WCC17_23985 [Candidatus Nitrosopolaris sp.]|jgi:hypothetical protein